MTWVDWVILAVLAGATLGGLAQGFFRTACSLAGLILGLTLAAWNYQRVGSMFKPIFRADAVANTVAFLLIALLVMGHRKPDRRHDWEVGRVSWASDVLTAWPEQSSDSFRERFW